MSIPIPSLSLLIAETPHAEEAGGLPQMDPSTFASQLFWLAITFGILFWAMRSVILPRLGGIIEERKDRIEDDLDRAASLKQEAEDAQQSYEQALSEARVKAQNIAGDTRKAIDEQIASMQATMEEELSGKVDAAEQRIADMQTTAAQKVHEAAIETTRAVVEALIEEVPTTDSVKSAIASITAT